MKKLPHYYFVYLITIILFVSSCKKDSRNMLPDNGAKNCHGQNKGEKPHGGKDGHDHGPAEPGECGP